MTQTPDNEPETPQNGAERASAGPANDPPHRFNPFAHEEDMFKVVLWVGGALLVLIVIVALARTIF